MKFDLTKFPVGDDDKQLKDETGKLANYRMVLMKSCTTELSGNGQPLGTEEKYQRYDMWKRFKDANKDIELTPEEVVMMKKITSLAYPVIIAGQCRDFLAHPEGEKK